MTMVFGTAGILFGSTNLTYTDLFYSSINLTLWNAVNMYKSRLT